VTATISHQMTWTDFEALLAENLTGFKPRAIQAALANAAALSWEAKDHILAQAGCGTGKSFVAAFVAYMRSLATGQPVIIATATKALQDQYAEKDLPFLASILEGLTFTVLKGRSNYVCLAKVDEHSQKVSLLAKTKVEGFSGEIADLGVSDDLGREVSTTSDECPGKSDCPFGDVCFAEKAKAKAKVSHIVIANHAVTAADMAVKAAQESIGVPSHKVVGILPNAAGMIIDEGHVFAGVVTDALGGSVTSGSYGRLGKMITEWFGDRHAADEFNKATEGLFGTVGRILANREDVRNKTLPMTEAYLTQVAPNIKTMTEALDKISARMVAVQVHGDDKKVQQRKRLVKRIDNASNKLRDFLAAGDEELVRWLEVAEGQKGNAICWAPLSVADFLGKNLFSKMPVMVMSATLALGNDFSYMQEQLGME
jgi:ATP-dependent DNA helicase DinG